MTKTKRLLSVICFIIIFFLILENVQKIFQAKWDDDSNTYARLRLFYQESPSPDVVFIGSSHVYYDINPLIIFQEQGIASYDFSAPSQGAEVVKLYVEEVLKTHSEKVKVIAIDTLLIYDVMHYEDRSRQWLDPVPLSINKMFTAQSILESNEEFNFNKEYDSLLSYAFPLLRYHDRWENITPNDFVLDQKVKYYHGATHYHGYGPHYRVREADFGYYNSEVKFNEERLKKAKEYFEDIVNLCKKSNTALLLLKTPSPMWRQGYHDLVQNWAEEYDLPFVDYNDMMVQLGFNEKTDFQDYSSHLNDFGACKLSHYIGEYLKDNYDLVDHREDPEYAKWDEDWNIYQQDKASYFLSNETDWTSYLIKLQNPNYTVYFAAKDNIGGAEHPELVGQLKDLGLTPELETAGQIGYIAVFEGGEKILERLEDVPLAWQGSVNNQFVSIVSENSKQGNRASIVLDGKEYFVDQRGIGIVVYDNLLEDVIDSVTFDLYGGGVSYR